jgi:hypothetical protein
MAITVTATQGGSTANGLVLRVFVLTGAAAVAAQSGASTNNQFLNATSFTQSITTTAGSNVYGASSHFPNAASTGSNATIVDDVADAANNGRYTTFKALNVTGGATTRGFTVATSSGPFAQLEILAAGTLAEDASGPAAASTTAAVTVTTASFTPPPGSLLVALVASDGGGTVTTMTVSGGGLVWAEKVKNNPSAGDYAGVWIADVPAAGGPLPAQPGQTWLRYFHHRQQPVFPSPPPAVVAAAPPLVAPFPQRRPAGLPARARLGRAAAVAAGILAATTLSPQPSAVPPSRPGPAIGHPAPHRAVTRWALARPQLPSLTAKLPPTALSPRPPHRATWRGAAAKTTLSPQPSSVPPPGWRQPVAPRPAHRAVWDALAAPPPPVVTVTAVAPARPGPVTSRPPPPHRATGKGILAATTLSAQPTRVPPPGWRQPNAPRPAHRAYWRAIAGPPPPVVTVTAVAPARPQPVTNRPPAPHRALIRGVLAVTTLSPQPTRVPPPQWRQPNAPRPAHRAYWRAVAAPPPPVAGPAPAAPSRPPPVTSRPPAPHRAITRRVLAAPPPLAPPSRPAPVTNRPPPPHRAIVRGVLAKTTLSAQPSRVAGPQWRQPFAPRPAHRAYWRAVAGAAPPPPPFTIGQLTAATAARGALTAAGAATGTLSAGGQARGQVSATDKAAGAVTGGTAPLGGIT